MIFGTPNIARGVFSGPGPAPIFIAPLEDWIQIKQANGLWIPIDSITEPWIPIDSPLDEWIQID